MNTKLLISIFVGLVSTASTAQIIGTAPPNSEIQYLYSKDSDNTIIQQVLIGGTAETGVGVLIGGSTISTRYLSASSEIIQGTYQGSLSGVEFRGAAGLRSVSHNTNTNKLGSELADQIISKNSNLTPGDIINIKNDAPAWSADEISSAGGSVAKRRQYLIIDAEVRLKITDTLGVGAMILSDVVQSEKSIQNGTAYTLLGADIDLQLSNELSITAAITNTFFSDSNNRLIIKSKVNYLVVPEYGISVFYRVKDQRDSAPNLGNYFSPDHLINNAIGISIRKFHNGLMFTASADYGDERIHNLGEITNKPVYIWQAGVQTTPALKNGITFGAYILESNTSSINATSGAYRWTGFGAWVKMPLQ